MWRKFGIRDVGDNNFHKISMDLFLASLVPVPNTSFEVYAPSFAEKILESHAVMLQVGSAGFFSNPTTLSRVLSIVFLLRRATVA